MSHFSQAGPSRAAGTGAGSDDEDPWGANGHINRAYSANADLHPVPPVMSGSTIASDQRGERGVVDRLPDLFGEVWRVAQRAEGGADEQEQSISIGQMNRILRSSGAGASVVEAVSICARMWHCTRPSTESALPIATHASAAQRLIQTPSLHVIDHNAGLPVGASHALRARAVSLLALSSSRWSTSICRGRQRSS